MRRGAPVALARARPSGRFISLLALRTASAHGVSYVRAFLADIRHSRVLLPFHSLHHCL